jgi:hypothetical protein
VSLLYHFIGSGILEIGLIHPRASEILFIKRRDITTGIEGHFENHSSTCLKKIRNRFSLMDTSGQGMNRGGCPILNIKSTDR